MSKPSKKFEMNAVVFRNIFAGIFILLLAIAILLAILGTSKLQSEAEGVRKVVDEADTIDQTNSRTVTLWDELQKNRKAADKAMQVVADTKSYAYQDVIVRDLKNFAQLAGIVITNYDFTASSSVSTQPSTAQPEGGAAAPDTSTAPANSSAPVIALKTTSVTVSLETPVDYRKLLTFIHYIEQNLTKMQISKVSLSRVAQDNPQAVNSDALSIEVYIR